MKIWDSGTYECLKWEPRKVEVALHGERLDARYALFAIGGEGADGDWMIHRMDPADDRRREPMPRADRADARALRQPARRGRRIGRTRSSGTGCARSPTASPGELRLESRNLNEITDPIPSSRELNRALGSHSAILDGEIVALDDEDGQASRRCSGACTSPAGRRRERLTADTPVTYMAFDLLWLDGHSLMGLPYSERTRACSPRWSWPGSACGCRSTLQGEGAALLAASAEQRLEGMVAKRLDSIYRPGDCARALVEDQAAGAPGVRRRRLDAGQGQAAVSSIGALLLGVHEPDGALRYVGRVGSGFSDAELERLAGLLARAAAHRAAFRSGERPPRGAHVLRAAPRRRGVVRGVDRATAACASPVYLGRARTSDAGHVVREQPDSGHATQQPA